MSLTKTETVRTTQNKKAGDEKDIGLYFVRILVVCVIYITYQNAAVIQGIIDDVWAWLRHQWWYQSVYSETFTVQVYSFPALFPYRLMYAVNIGAKYRIAKQGGKYELPSYKDILVDILEYTLPLFLIDTFHVKRYADVPDDVIAEKRQLWIQTTRALPIDPPLLSDLVRHLVLGLVAYDACFFLQHFIFHKNATLYRLFHKKHHEHTSVNVRVTNRLHVVERIALVLSANFGLKIQGAHPLTRTIFIFTFISLLVDNHSGYDFPYTYDKILPRGLVGGAKRHFEHHEYGTRNYQPIFTYLDYFVGWIKKNKMNMFSRKSTKNF